MKRIKPILRIILPLLFAAEATLASLDADTTGADDNAARVVHKIAVAVQALLNDEEIELEIVRPAAAEALAKAA